MFFTTYGCGGRLGHVPKPICLNILFHCSQKFAHEIWFRMTKQFFFLRERETRFNFEFLSNLWTRSKNDLDTHVASFTHASTNFEAAIVSTILKILLFPIQKPQQQDLTMA